MARILVLYSTTDGQVALIAHTIEKELLFWDHAVDVRDVRALPSSFSARSFDGVIIGGSIRWGHHAAPLRDYLRANAALLAKKPAWLYSVSLAASGNEGLEHAESLVLDLLAETGWSPERWEVFAGALRYTAYGPLLRRLMKLIARRAHLSTDTSTDHDYTDWSAVQRLAREFSERLEPHLEGDERSELVPITLTDRLPAPH